MKSIFVLALCLLFTACGPKAVRIATPPAERFEQVEEPAVPEGDSDADVASYIISLITALRTANSRLAWLDDWQREVSE